MDGKTYRAPTKPPKFQQQRVSGQSVLYGPTLCAVVGLGGPRWYIESGPFFCPGDEERLSDEKVYFGSSGMKLGITGSRSNTEFDFTALFSRQVKEFNFFLGRRRITSLITGGASGIDTLAEKCAKKLNIPCQIIRPDYSRYHRNAPLKRNLQIIEKCDALLVIWNGSPASRGTVYTASHALKSGKPVFVILAAGKNIAACICNIHDDTVFDIRFQK